MRAQQRSGLKLVRADSSSSGFRSTSFTIQIHFMILIFWTNHIMAPTFFWPLCQCSWLHSIVVSQFVSGQRARDRSCGHAAGLCPFCHLQIASCRAIACHWHLRIPRRGTCLHFDCFRPGQHYFQNGGRQVCSSDFIRRQGH